MTNRNILSGNVIDAVGGSGINIVSSDDTQVLGNQITGLPTGGDGARAGIRIATTAGVTAESTLVRRNIGTPDQRPLYGLNMTSAAVLDTVVTGNRLYGSRAAIRDLGTRTVYQ